MILVLEIEYKDNVTDDVVTSNITMASCLGYIHTSTQGKLHII
jgi:hypothetical protein